MVNLGAESGKVIIKVARRAHTGQTLPQKRYKGIFGARLTSAMHHNPPCVGLRGAARAASQTPAPRAFASSGNCGPYFGWDLDVSVNAGNIAKLHHLDNHTLCEANCTRTMGCSVWVYATDLHTCWLVVVLPDMRLVWTQAYNRISGIKCSIGGDTTPPAVCPVCQDCGEVDCDDPTWTYILNGVLASVALLFAYWGVRAQYGLHCCPYACRRRLRLGFEGQVCLPPARACHWRSFGAERQQNPRRETHGGWLPTHCCCRWMAVWPQWGIWFPYPNPFLSCIWISISFRACKLVPPQSSIIVVVLHVRYHV